MTNFDSVKFLDALNVGGYPLVKMLYGDALLNALSSSIRSVFIPDPGYDMFSADFSAIEPRVLFWLAEEAIGIQMFIDQDNDPNVPDIYVHMARTIYNKRDLAKKNKAERQLGKQAVLGCGYGMGHDRFQDTCASYDIIIGQDLAIRSVQSYRRMFRKVVRFWYALENAAKQCLITKRTQQVGKVLFYLDGEWLRMKLPAGRTIVYHHPKIVDDKLTFLGLNNITQKYEIEEIWGGTLCENCTQAVARDIMAEAMFTFATTGYQILFTVHDEVIVQARKGTKTVNDVLKVMRTIPSWAKGCPINAECEQTERYKK